MSFREKSTWISFVLLLAMTAASFWVVSQIWSGRVDSREALLIYHNALVAFVALQIVLHAVIVIQSPRDARTPKDERERLIELKSFRLGFYVLVIGALASLLSSHHPNFGLSGLGHGVLASILVAWLIKLGAQLAYFRRGS